MKTSFRSVRLYHKDFFLGFLLSTMLVLGACQTDTGTEGADPAEVTQTEPDQTRKSDRVNPEGESANTVPDSESLSGDQDLESAQSAPLYEAQRDVMAPDFSLPALDGNTFRLSDYQGKVVVINFWATWCPPCLQEIPEFIELQEELGEEGVQFVGISLDEEGFEIVRPFAQEYEFNYPIVVDDGTAAEQYGPIASMPTTFIVGRDGRVRRYAPGMLTESALRPVLVELLNEKA